MYKDMDFPFFCDTQDIQTNICHLEICFVIALHFSCQSGFGNLQKATNDHLNDKVTNVTTSKLGNVRCHSNKNTTTKKCQFAV